MTDTKFPKEKDVLIGSHVIGYTPLDEIANWFQRCIKDFPFVRNFDVDDPMFFPNCCRERSLWFKKWFEQFKEET